MSLRNKLLNFKEYKRQTAKIIDEDPREIYHQLVVEQDSMRFLPSEDHEPIRGEEVSVEDTVAVTDEGGFHCRICGEENREGWFSDRGAIDDHLAVEHDLHFDTDETLVRMHTPGEIESLWDLPDPDEEKPERHSDEFLQTDHPEEALQKRLFHIHNKANALIEDAGYNALHLALGFLEWEPAGSDVESPRAPLILVPIELSRKGATSDFEVQWNEEEVVPNLSLQMKLKEQGIDLPEFEPPDDKRDIWRYLEQVQEKVSEEGWDVRPEIYVGMFDFTKFVMYKDLDPDSWPAGSTPLDHPRLRELLDPTAEPDEPEPFPEDEIDERLSSSEVYHVLDADPSQIAVIEDVKNNRDLVVEGPPGTGKSQTIVNLIGELLAHGQTVLFVSEKMAALDVVKERLESVGLGDFCLELHSNKASKSDFLEELERLAKMDKYDPDFQDAEFKTVDELRERLNSYATALAEPFGRLQWSPYKLYNTVVEAREHFGEDGIPVLSLQDPISVEPEEHRQALEALRGYRENLSNIGDPTDHPWRGTDPGSVLPRRRRDIEGQVATVGEAMRKLRRACHTLSSQCSIREPATVDEIREALDAARVLADSEPLDSEVLKNPEWNQMSGAARDLLEDLDRYLELQFHLASTYDAVPPDLSLEEVRSEYDRLSEKLSRFFTPSWWRIRGQLKQAYSRDIPSDHSKVLLDLGRAIEFVDLHDSIQERRDLGRNLFGSHWEGTDSDPEALRAFADWLVKFRGYLLDDVLAEEVISEVAQGVEERTIDNAVDEVQSALDEFLGSLDEVAQEVDIDFEAVFSTKLDDLSLGPLEKRLRVWKDHMADLEEWGRYVQARASASQTPAGPVVERADAGALGPEDVLPAYLGNLAHDFLEVAFQEREALSRFKGDTHEDRIQEFQEVDKEVLQLNRERALAKLTEGLPDFRRGASRNSQVGDLIHEFGKKRRHKPIRKLLDDNGPLIKELKPCFMMSPLSVAKYIDPGSMTFDVVIFDEASQVPPHEALGAILRGDSLVMMGDTKQLPPTSFFDHVVDHRERSDPYGRSITDVESILDVCKTTYPERRLKWHYRSRDESLIAVSNQEFYDNELVVFPSPYQADSDENLGLELEYLPETTYDRGGSSVNREEAKRVAEAAKRHYEEHPDKSLGIGTFSRAQQQAVMEEVEILRKENPGIDEYFSTSREEHFFVKNLERIQGDERDVIFISVGYGFDDADRLTTNFGPLNHEGGWRRLNVLITRARERCVVFSNFTADDLEVGPGAPKGVRSLKIFLDYAQNRNLKSITDVGGDPESPFERAVKNFLELEGYTVHAQVGSAGYRIDLAIVDSERPGRYLLGIECDGASYHSSMVARERDRIRQDVLEDRGWLLHRVWSTDWYRNPEKTKERLLDGIQEAKRSPRRSSVAVQGTNEKTKSEDGNDLKKITDELVRDDFQESIQDLASPYEKANPGGYLKLSEATPSQVATLVSKIVEVESPVHIEVVFDRVRENSDAGRLGKNLKKKIRRGIKRAQKQGKIERRDNFNFLWNTDQDTPSVRQRTGGPDADIDRIPKAEIDEAIKLVLENQLGTPREELTKQTAYLLGFKRTSNKTASEIEERIEGLLSQGDLRENRDGVLHIG